MFPVVALYSRYAPSETRLNAPTRKTSSTSFSPSASVTGAENSAILPDSVISFCSASHTFSISSIEASLEELLICSESCFSSSERPGYCAEITEFWKLPAASLVTCCNTPKSSFNEPMLCVKVSCKLPNLVSLLSKRVSKSDACCSSA